MTHYAAVEVQTETGIVQFAASSESAEFQGRVNARGMVNAACAELRAEGAKPMAATGRIVSAKKYAALIAAGARSVAVA